MEKCPKCGYFMEEGYLVNAGTLFSRNKHPFMWLEPGDVRIIPLWGMGRRPALYCRKCELMIFLPNEKRKANRNSRRKEP